MVTTRLQNEFDRQLSSVSHELGRMRLSFDAEIEHFNSTVVNLGKQGISYVIKGNYINNGSVLAARDGIATAAKTLGLDLSKALKFKPWGAVNMAKNINGALAIVGLVLEAYDSYKRHERDETFREAVKDIVDNFNSQREELLAMINSDSFQANFFPDYAALKTNADDVQEAINTQTKLRMDFQNWRESGELIEAEFTLVNH